MRRRILRLLAWLLVGLTVSFLLPSAIIRLDQYLLRRRAERLLTDIRSLELGKSTYADARRVITRWGSEARQQGLCRADWCDVDIRLADLAGSHAEFIWRTRRRARVFLWLGARPAIVDASVRIRSDVVVGKLIEAHVEGPCRDSNDQTFCLTVIGRVQTGGSRYINPRHPEYSIFSPDGCTYCVAPAVIFSPYAIPADVLRLTDINFGCITRWTLCENEQDILPAAWAQRQAERALPAYAGGTCSETIRVLSRELGSVPLATVTSVANVGEGPQITVRWEEQGSPQAGRRRQTFPLPDKANIRNGERLLVFEDSLFSSSAPCAVVPATEETLRIAREGVAEDLSDHTNTLDLPFGGISRPRVDLR
jgi:hypothetical protein